MLFNNNNDDEDTTETLMLVSIALIFAISYFFALLELLSVARRL